MTVVIACDVPLCRNNGTSVAAMNLVKSLRSKGHTVRIIAPELDEKNTLENTYTADIIDFGPFNNYVKSNGVVVAKPSKKKVNDILEGADLLHTITPFFMCSYAVSQAKKMNIPVTSGFHCQAENITSHFFLMNCQMVNKRIYRFLYKNLYKDSDCIHYPTQFIRDVFENSISLDTNGKVISNGVGEEFTFCRKEKPEYLKDKFIIVFTGRYSREKSHKVLIDAVCKSHFSDSIQLVFAGSGPQENKIKKYGNKLKNKPIMEFFEKKDLIDVLHYADLYVHPAEIEIEAIACLEAIKCGLVPVISDSARSATRFFALNKNNLFKCNDSDDLSQKIDYWINHPVEKKVCSIQYNNYTNRYDRKQCMDEMENMMKEILLEYKK